MIGAKFRHSGLQEVLISLLVSILLTCGSDNGHGPKPAVYDIFVSATKFSTRPNEHLIYVLSADSLRLKDSILVEAFLFSIRASPDGNWLYTVRSSFESDAESGLTKRSAHTGDVVWFLPGKEEIVSLHKNGELLVYGQEVLCARDGNLVSKLPDTVFPGRGPLGSTIIAARICPSEDCPEGRGHLAALNIETGELSGQYVPHLSSGRELTFLHSLLHPDGTRVLVLGYGRRFDDSWFVIGDLKTGETLAQYSLVYSLGEIAISSDGHYAVVSDPSWPLIFDSAPTIDVFDLDEMSHVHRFEFSPSELTYPAQIAFLPDDHSVITFPRADLVSVGPVQFINLKSLTIEFTSWLPPGDAAFTGALALIPRQGE